MDIGGIAKLTWADVKHMPMVPLRASSGASGFDLQAFGNYELRPFEPVLVRTGWRIEIQPGFEGQVRPRSGLALKHAVTVLNAPGTIDSDYRGEIGVVLYLGKPGQRYEVRNGDRIAQLVIAPVYMGGFEIIDELSKTVRGTDGFGSTGAR